MIRMLASGRPPCRLMQAVYLVFGIIEALIGTTITPYMQLFSTKRRSGEGCRSR
jgi:hypothetical protein